jgi:hypothetical protein
MIVANNETNETVTVQRKPLFRLWLALVAFVPVLTLGCGVPFSRVRPSESDYIARYLKYFDPSQIEKLDFVYEGAVGGESTVARVQFKGPVVVRPLGKAATEGVFDPAKLAKERDRLKFRRQWTFSAGGTLPSWFDLPFDRKMRLIQESQEGSDGKPRYDWAWYVDDERNVVYFCGNRG